MEVNEQPSTVYVQLNNRLTQAAECALLCYWDDSRKYFHHNEMLRHIKRALELVSKDEYYALLGVTNNDAS